MIARVLIGGVAIGVTYTLSPLLVIAMLALALIWRWIGGVEDRGERRWILAMLGVAIAARLLVIGALFLSTDHAARPFGRLFGDEEYFIRRSIWLANLALGIPISIADVKYAFDGSIQTSFVWMLASLHVLFGPSQYGVRFISAAIYLAGAIALYRTVRPTFGKPSSLIGLALLLFLPSLFVWSISVLKEPVFFGLLAGVVALTVFAWRRRSWLPRLGAVTGIIAASYVAETLRDGGLVIALVGTVLGVIMAICFARPRVLVAVITLSVVVASAALGNGRVQDRMTAAAAAATRQHWDHVNSPGHSYTIFEPAFYRHEPLAGSLSARDHLRLLIGGLTAYVAVPLPWQMRSPFELAYLVEQVLWYAMVLLLPIGIAAGLKRDVLVSSILLGHLTVSVMLVAVTSGNIGTLVRHRALAMPYIVWFAGLGLSVVMAWIASAQPTPRVFVQRPEAEA
jgi:4-amino-4-deoxy-L-arabinose transferase-like glycosyltransferase